MPKNNKSLKKLNRKFPKIFAILREPNFIANQKKQIELSKKLNELAKKMVLVKCPKCKTLQVGYKEISLTFGSCFCECKKCGFLITESDWEEVEKTSENNCDHELVSKEYESQNYGTCLSCGQTLFNL